MASVIKHYEGIDSVAVIGNYLPRQCGIATFTTDLVESLSAEAPDIYCWAAAMNDKPEGYQYPDKVRFEINQNKLTDYSVASQFLNISQTDIVCVQHEYGLFGGPAGSHLLKLLGDLRMPVVTTLHTILKDPAPEYRDVMCKLSDLSDKLVVMSRKASDFLKDIYAVSEEKIAFIHHGIPDTPFIDPSFYKDKFGVEGKKVLLTFGLLSSNKGIDDVIPASCNIATIPFPIAPMATAPMIMPERYWLPPWVKNTCQQSAWDLIFSTVIISDSFCMPIMKKMGAFAIS